MKYFTTYLSTAPVVALLWFTFTAGLLIETKFIFLKRRLLQKILTLSINKSYSNQ